MDSSLEPDVVGLLLGPVELVVRLERHVGEEGRLRSAEVLEHESGETASAPTKGILKSSATHVAAAAVEDLAVVLDLELSRRYSSASVGEARTKGEGSGRDAR